MCALAIGLQATSADGTSFQTRSFPVSQLLAPDQSADVTPTGAPANASISSNGGVIAYDADAGSAVEVYSLNVVSGANTLISSTPARQPAGGQSLDPSVSYSGQSVAFMSTSNEFGRAVSVQHFNVWVHKSNGQIVLASQGIGGANANGSSVQPMISGNGSYVVFTSYATNLISKNRSPYPQVYEYSVRTGTLSLVSSAARGGPGNGTSTSPSVSATGQYVAFASTANDLVKGAKTPAPEVFVRNMKTGRTKIVSVSSKGRTQNATLPSPLVQTTSISANGSAIAFDSSATDLVQGVKHARPNIYVRYPSSNRTVLASAAPNGTEGNGASTAPILSPNGTEVAFDSTATNIAGGGGRSGLNVLEHDLSTGGTTVIDVGPQGQRPASPGVIATPPALSSGGDDVTFESSAAALTGLPAGSANAVLELLAPPVGSLQSGPVQIGRGKVRLTVRADDPLAREFLCELDRLKRFYCGPGAITLRNLTAGRHTLSVWVGGVGMLFAKRPVVTSFEVTG